MKYGFNCPNCNLEMFVDNIFGNKWRECYRCSCMWYQEHLSDEEATYQKGQRYIRDIVIPD